MKWQERYKVIPDIVSSVGELDASLMLGHSLENLRLNSFLHNNEGFDFIINSIKYQVKATRQSDNGNIRVRIGRINTEPKHLDSLLDKFIWIKYNEAFRIIKAKILSREELFSLKKEGKKKIDLLVAKLETFDCEEVLNYNELNNAINATM